MVVETANHGSALAVEKGEGRYDQPGAAIGAQRVFGELGITGDEAESASLAETAIFTQSSSFSIGRHRWVVVSAAALLLAGATAAALFNKGQSGDARDATGSSGNSAPEFPEGEKKGADAVSPSLTRNNVHTSIEAKKEIQLGAPVPTKEGGFELHGVNITIVPEHLFKKTPDGRTKVGMVHIPMDVHEKILAPFKEKGLTPDHDFDRYPDKKNRPAFIATTPNGGFIITYYKSFQGYCVPPTRQSDGSMSDGESFMFPWIKGLNSKENVPGKQNPAIRALFEGMQTLDSLDDKEVPKAFRSLPRGNYLPFMNGYLEMYINSAGLKKLTPE